MKLTLGLLVFVLTGAAHAQAWKTLPKGVRILGYRNVTTSNIKSNFDQFRSERSLSAEFKVDAIALNNIAGNPLRPGDDIDDRAYQDLTVGEYKVDANARANVHGFGFGYGITDNVMYYAEIAYYNAQVDSRIKRTKGNNYEEIARYLRHTGKFDNVTASEFIARMPDVTENTVQSVVHNYFGYKPIGTWQGSGYGDMETGFMIKAIDKGTWGVQLFPGVILPTGRQDDPDILQDMGFGDGQFDLFGEVGTGYVVNDRLMFGTTLRYTHQLPTTQELRIPTERDFPLSREKGMFDVKYGDRINFMVNAPIMINDWFSVIPFYRFMYQLPTQYDSQYTEANEFLGYNSDKQEHQLQLTTSLSSIQPFLKKQFLLPAQINMNLVQVVGGKNVPKMGRFEIEFRMLF